MARGIHVDEVNEFVVMFEFDVYPSAKNSISFYASSLCNWYFVVPVEILVSVDKFWVNVRVDNDYGYTTLNMIIRVMILKGHVGNACKCFGYLVEFTLGFLYEKYVIPVGFGVIIEIKDFIMSATPHVNGPYPNVVHVAWRSFPRVPSMSHEFMHGMCVGGLMWYVMAVMYDECLVMIGDGVSRSSMCGVNPAPKWWVECGNMCDTISA